MDETPTSSSVQQVDVCSDEQIDHSCEIITPVCSSAWKGGIQAGNGPEINHVY